MCYYQLFPFESVYILSRPSWKMTPSLKMCIRDRHKICISGNAYTHMRVHMHIRITDCFFPQHLLMWVSLTSSPEHTARQCRNFTFPATAVKLHKGYYCYCCGSLIGACITANMYIVRGMSACITGNMHIVMRICICICTYA